MTEESPKNARVIEHGQKSSLPTQDGISSAGKGSTPSDAASVSEDNAATKGKLTPDILNMVKRKKIIKREIARWRRDTAFIALAFI